MGTGSSQYTASYDTSGNMVCRAPDGSTTCAGGTTTGQQLSWDNEGRLVAWQNAPSSPTSTAQYLYDGEGNRVEQQATTSGTTTTTTYVGSLESVATTGGTSTTTTYYYAAGQRIALAVNGTLSYLASDLLGSATVALNDSGTPTASQLYAPYGGVRYSNDTMPTDYGFTGQRVDSTTGLDYYGARYYDPTLGQFTSADTVMDGLNRYGYVGGNPISHTDPRGHRDEEMPDGYGDGGAASGNGGIGEGGESGEGNSGGGGPGTVGDGLTTGPAGDMSPDLVVIQTPEGFEYVDPAITDADLQAETQDIQQTTQQLHNENDDQSQEPQNPSKLSNPSNPSNHPENPDNPNTPQTPNQQGNPGTTVSSTSSGTIVTTGTQAGSGPFFQSTLSSDGSNFTMQYAYRNGLPDHASDVFAKQFDLAGGNPAQLQQLTLENIEESQTIAQWMEWGSLAGSTLDKMSNYFANSIGVQLGAPSWSGPNIIYPILP